MGMCVGEIRHIHVPSEMAFGSVGLKGLHGEVGPDEDLYYEVEMIDILKYDSATDERLMKKELSPKEAFDNIDEDGDGRISKVEFFNKFLEEQLDSDDEREDKAVRKEVIAIVREVFKAEDFNRDGYLTFSERQRHVRSNLESMRDDAQSTYAKTTAPKSMAANVTKPAKTEL